ncbi:MAG: nucleoside triphosphate pyrophosphohydrolase [Candidatus Liptonbacteria bacterium]|nr:nucleoside triphosphate pyrophosphohydrolase [Candidatus Liptonbacteria bacterium]
MKYDKLVRNRIPDIIRAKGGQPKTHTASETEYAAKLTEKLREEVEEFLRDRNPEELADILEVVKALAETQGRKLEDIERMRVEKEEERGGFDERIILEES